MPGSGLRSGRGEGFYDFECCGVQPTCMRAAAPGDAVLLMLCHLPAETKASRFVVCPGFDLSLMCFRRNELW